MEGVMYCHNRRYLINLTVFLVIWSHGNCQSLYTTGSQDGTEHLANNVETDTKQLHATHNVVQGLNKDAAEVLQSGDEIIYLTTEFNKPLEPQIEKERNYDKDSEKLQNGNLIINLIDGSRNVKEGSEATNSDTKSLEQNIEDYYNSVDIEFENLSENDNVMNELLISKSDGHEKSVKSNNLSPNHDGSEDIPNVLHNPLNVDKDKPVRSKRNAKSKELSDDDIEQEIYEELVETYDDENIDNTEEFTKSTNNDETLIISNNENGEKIYRDTFMDRIIEDMKVKHPKNVAKREKRDLKYVRNKELTGDTVLHLRSEISDVIKSETDLKSTLLSDKQFTKENVKSDSYVDNIMIHPSDFIQDNVPFETKSKPNNKEDGTKQTVDNDSGTNQSKQNKSKYENSKRNNGENASFETDVQNDWTSGQDANNEAFEDNTTTYNNDSDVILAVLDSRKLLKCHLKVKDVKSLVWIKDGERVPVSGAAGSAYEVTSKGDIIIKRVGREHQGKWRCEEKTTEDNTLRSADRDRDLLVMESPSAPYLEVFGRRLDPGNVFLPAREGTELVMACHVERGNPTPTLHWETSKPVHMTHQHTQGSQVTSSIAVLVVRRSHHNATISCVCRHPALNVPMVASTLVHVQYAPRFGISRTPGFGFPLEEGSAVSLRCEVDSNPPATPTWRKDEREPPVEQTDDGYLNFTSVRREHSGWYKCSATHPLGNFSSIGYFLNVRYEVESATEQQVYHHTAGRNEEHLAGGVVQLQCPPGSVGCWSRDTPPPPSSVPVGLIRQDKQGGSYVCSGLSPSEASRLHTMLGEHNAFNGGAPVVYPSNASLTVKEESSVTLEGEFCVETGQPPARVLWLAQGRALGLPDSYNRITTHHSTPTNSTPSVQCNIAKLSINKCTAGDSGEYSLVVRGRRGIGEAIFHVQVLERDKQTLLEQAYNGGPSAIHRGFYVVVSIFQLFVAYFKIYLRI